MRFVWFSYYKTANRIALCGVVWCNAVQYYLRCDAVMPFYKWFWYDFYGLYGLRSLVNTPTFIYACVCTLLFFTAL